MRLGSVLRLATVEGITYAGMVGLGEFWFAADAVRLEASALALAALVTLPSLVGALGSVGMLRALRRAPTRRPLVVATVAAQAVSFALLGVLTALDAVTAWGLVGFASAHALFGQAAGTAWSSWFGELVPSRIRGRWFGGRGRWVHATTFAGILLGGLVLQWVEPQAAEAAGRGGSGFAALFLAAAALRFVSVGLLARTWEPSFHPPDPADRVTSVLRGPDAAGARGVVLTGAAMLLAVCVASPFFAPHMLDTLRFSYLTYLGAQGVLVAAKVASLGAWGRLVDRAGALTTYRVAAVLIALVPVPWALSGHTAVIFAAQALSGVAWGGHEVAILALTLQATDPRARAVLLTAQNLANGSAQVVGGMFGTVVASWSAGAHAVMFATSAALRLVVALGMPRSMRSLQGGRPGLRATALRVVGWSPHGGVVRQVVAGVRGQRSGSEPGGGR